MPQFAGVPLETALLTKGSVTLHRLNFCFDRSPQVIDSFDRLLLLLLLINKIGLSRDPEGQSIGPGYLILPGGEVKWVKPEAGAFDRSRGCL